MFNPFKKKNSLQPTLRKVHYICYAHSNPGGAPQPGVVYYSRNDMDVKRAVQDIISRMSEQGFYTWGGALQVTDTADFMAGTFPLWAIHELMKIPGSHRSAPSTKRPVFLIP